MLELARVRTIRRHHRHRYAPGDIVEAEIVEIGLLRNVFQQAQA